MLVFISGTSGGGISNYFLNRILEKENEGGFLSWAISFLEVIIGTKWLWVIDLFIYKGFSLNFVLLVICYFGISTLFSILFVFKLFSSLFFILIEIKLIQLNIQYSMQVYLLKFHIIKGRYDDYKIATRIRLYIAILSQPYFLYLQYEHEWSLHSRWRFSHMALISWLTSISHHNITFSR